MGDDKKQEIEQATGLSLSCRPRGRPKEPCVPVLAVFPLGTEPLFVPRAFGPKKRSRGTFDSVTYQG